ncbi:hypothetical protein JCM8097_003296 [Rhodosporidiobolus ruineniae]
MSHPQQTASPPSTTSLPEHWQFVPPPTDGPNTRARRARGEMPYSGTAKGLPMQLAVRGPGSGEGEEGREEINVWGETEAGQQFWHPPDPQTEPGYFAVDPSLPLDLFTPSYTPVEPSPGPDSDFSSFAQREPLFRPEHEDRRIFSSSTVIDHGSPPPASPPLVPFDSSASSSASPARPESLATGMGMTKEEWLRLGGFEEVLPQPHLPPQTAFDSSPVKVEQTFALPLPSISQELDIFSSSAFGAEAYEPVSSQSAHPLGTTSFFLPSPTQSYSLPPPASAPPMSTYVLPPPPPPPVGVDYPSSFAVELPEPPMQLKREVDLNARPPTRATGRSAPSPAVSSRHRPAPYPTSSSSSSRPPLMVEQPSSPSLSRTLTPISAALASYPSQPVPSSPGRPSSPVPAPELGPDGKKKRKLKSHGRRVSIGHIPRPRNAFILFRSHAVQTGLIPKTMGITDHKNISQIVGGVWRGLSEEERRQWEELAKEEKRLHKEKYPDYKFAPKQKGTRAPIGEGKKAKARAARDALERIREEALSGSGSSGVDRDSDAGDGSDADYRVDSDSEYASSAAPTPKKPRRPQRKAAVAASTKAAWLEDEGGLRSQRRMELIAQAVLEGEDEETIMARVDEELEREDEAMRTAEVVEEEEKPKPLPAPSRPATRSSPNKPPPSTQRKTRSAIQHHQRPSDPSPRRVDDIIVNPLPLPTSPASSSSTLSPSRGSPYALAAQQRRGGLPTSPASSASPSPKRMQQPGSHSHSATSAGRHPLSHSHPAPPQDYQEHDLPVSRRTKKTYGGLGVSSSTVTLPPSQPFDSSSTSSAPYYPSHDPSALDQPLFAGPTDSRNFSLGRWELRKPSTAAPSRREMLAQQEEEQPSPERATSSTTGWLDRVASPGRVAGAAGGNRVTSLALSKDFLAETGLDRADDLGDSGLYSPAPDPWETASIASGPSSSVGWGMSSAASTYSGYVPSVSSAATTLSRPSVKQPLFRPLRREPTLPSALLPSSSHSNTGDPFCPPSSSFLSAFAIPEPPTPAGGSDDFHFGAIDLFAKPPPALAVSRTASGASTSTLFGGAEERSVRAGLGIDFGETGRRGK